MAKEESPHHVTRRVTRSAVSPCSPNKATETTRTFDNPRPTVDDLVFGKDAITVEELLSNFPGRNLQILELMQLIGPLNSPMIPVFLYGGAATGKTNIILQIFRHLNRPFVYASCLACYSPRILFESVLNQIMLHRRTAASGYSSVKRCDRPSDFVNFLKDALVEIISNLKVNSGKSSSKKLVRQAKGEMIYIIFDGMEHVRDWDKNSSTLSFLFKLHEILKMPEVGLIFISNASPDTYYSNTGHMDPTPVHFPDYSEDDLRQIFMRNQENPKLYSSFLDVALKPFSRITRQVDELSMAFSSLFKKYCEPLADMALVPNEEMKRKLYCHVKPHIAPSLNEILWVPHQASVGTDADKKKVSRKITTWKLGHSQDLDNDLEFHMSTSAKYLLISAFLASRNPATLDASLFDSTGGSDSRKRKRKASTWLSFDLYVKKANTIRLSSDIASIICPQFADVSLNNKPASEKALELQSSVKSLEQKETAEQELFMKGPGTFPLERLLAIFQCIASVAEASSEEEIDDEAGLGAACGNSGLMSDVLLQLSSLCNANFISKGGTCPLEGSTRYRSTVTEDMALKVARSLKFPLSKYLYRR